MKKLVLAAALMASALTAAPAAAVTFIVNLGNAPIAVPGVNDFQQDLDDHGYTHESIGASVLVSGHGRITFEFLGSESGFKDKFNFPGLPSFQESSTFENHFDAPVDLGSVNAGAGPLQLLFTAIGTNSRAAAPGQAGFAVFLKPGVTANFESNVIYFGYDDKAQLDDNHDDMIIRATISPIPEPATWAMMIGGLGLVGATMRRGRGMKAVTA